MNYYIDFLSKVNYIAKSRLPLRERAARRCNNLDWVRGGGATPHPTEFVEGWEQPSPARGEGANTESAPVAIP
jgi:hypothetical protein